MFKRKPDYSIEMGDAYWRNYFKFDELEQKIKSDINIIYRSLGEVDISIKISEGYFHAPFKNLYVYIHCSWMDGVKTSDIKYFIKQSILDHINKIKHPIRINLQIKYEYVGRRISTNAIIRESQKYLKCCHYDKCLPINIATLKIIYYEANDKRYSVYNLVVEELESLDYIPAQHKED